MTILHLPVVDSAVKIQSCNDQTALSAQVFKMKTRLYRLNPCERSRLVDELAAELESNPEVLFAYVYGSSAESEYFHDLDVGVYLRAPDADPTLPSTLAQRLSAHLKIPVDVRRLNDAPVQFLFHVLQGHLVLNRDQDILSAIIEDTARRYLDIAPLLLRSTKEAFSE